MTCFFHFEWCRGRDSNPHGLLHTPLKRARLPITPPRPVNCGLRIWECGFKGVHPRNKLSKSQGYLFAGALAGAVFAASVFATGACVEAVFASV